MIFLHKKDELKSRFCSLYRFQRDIRIRAFIMKMATGCSGFEATFNVECTNGADVTCQTQAWDAASTYLELGGESCCVLCLSSASK